MKSLKEIDDRLSSSQKRFVAFIIAAIIFFSFCISFVSITYGVFSILVLLVLYRLYDSLTTDDALIGRYVKLKKSGRYSQTNHGYLESHIFDLWIDGDSLDAEKAKNTFLRYVEIDRITDILFDMKSDISQKQRGELLKEYMSRFEGSSWTDKNKAMIKSLCLFTKMQKNEIERVFEQTFYQELDAFLDSCTQEKFIEAILIYQNSNNFKSSLLEMIVKLPNKFTTFSSFKKKYKVAQRQAYIEHIGERVAYYDKFHTSNRVNTNDQLSKKAYANRIISSLLNFDIEEIMSIQDPEHKKKSLYFFLSEIEQFVDNLIRSKGLKIGKKTDIILKFIEICSKRFNAQRASDKLIMVNIVCKIINTLCRRRQFQILKKIDLNSLHQDFRARIQVSLGTETILKIEKYLQKSLFLGTVSVSA